MYANWDELDEGSSYGGKNSKPFWSLDTKDEDARLKWLNNELKELKKEDEDFCNEVRKHIQLYKGIQYFSQEARTSRRDREETTAKFKQRTVINHLYDLTEQMVSRLTKFKPAISVLPIHDEIDDRTSAKVAKITADHIAYEQEFDDKIQSILRMCFVCGEAYLFVEWNPDIGPEFEPFTKAMESNLDVKLLDESGNPVGGIRESKKLIRKEDSIRIGDVELKVVSPSSVFFEIKDRYEDSMFMFKCESMDVDLLKKRYPKAKDKIKHNKDKTYTADRDQRMHHRETQVHTFYHKKSRELPNGRIVKFTSDVILDDRDLPFSHGEFPCERLSNIDVPDEARGRSIYSMIRSMQAHVNNLTSMQIRNQYMAAHPKWFVPYGSVKLESLGNDMTIVQYKGGVPPQLATFNATSGDTLQLRQQLVQEMGQISGIHGVSRSDPPSGVNSGVALQFLSEQEHERSNAMVSKFNNFIRGCFDKMIKTAADYYSEDDNRVVKLLGPNNAWMADKLDPAHLSKPFDVRIQNSTALPQSQAARMQTILDLQKQMPELFSNEQILDMLNLSKTERFFDQGTSAVRTAENRYDDFIEGKEVMPPDEYDFHVHHWQVFSKKIQDYSFKKLPEDIKQRVLDDLMAREMMMLDKAQKNEAFAQLLQGLPNFPLLFEPEPVDEVPAEAYADEAQLTPGEDVMPEDEAMAMDEMPMDDMASPMNLENQEAVNPDLPPVGLGQ